MEEVLEQKTKESTISIEKERKEKIKRSLQYLDLHLFKFVHIL